MTNQEKKLTGESGRLLESLDKVIRGEPINASLMAVSNLMMALCDKGMYMSSDQFYAYCLHLSDAYRHMQEHHSPIAERDIN